MLNKLRVVDILLIFDPQQVKKNQALVTDEIDQKIPSMFSMSMKFSINH